MAGHWSIRVTGNWRVTFRFADGEAVDLDAIGWSTARFWLAPQAQYDIAALRRERTRAA